jgi:Ca2+-binding EF-hand superfamily protein
MNSIFKDTKTAFESFATNGLLTKESLVKAIQSIHEDASADKIRKIFDISDVDTSRAIDFKEFITALVIAMTLNELPPAANLTPRSSFHALTRYEDLRSSLSQIASAYLIFDQNCEGQFSRSSVTSTVSSGTFLNESRWNEMVS